MSKFPFHIILSVAHTQEEQDENSYKENDLSSQVCDILADLLQESGITYSLVEEWSEEGEKEHSRVKKRKAVNRIVAVHHKPCLAIEIHWNNPAASSGTCILHDKVSSKSKAIAESMLPILLKELGRGQHHIGVIPFPSSYRNITLEFLRNTKCRAVIIEVDSIKHYEVYQKEEMIEQTAKGILKAIKGLKHGN